MTTKQVTVTKYIACDGLECNTLEECKAHEREVWNILENDAYQLRLDKRELLYAINEARINAQISLNEAKRMKPTARSAAGKSEYCKMVAEYWRLTSEYNAKRRELYMLRRKASIVINNLYVWFGRHKKKSSVARLERKKRSCAWRRENTPDKWNTPNKIRVNKLPKEVKNADDERGED